MQGITLAEGGHFANILPPVDVTGGVKSDIFKLGKWEHATILVQIGVSAAAFTKLILNYCSAADGTGETAMAYNAYKCETATGDVLGARTAVPATGLAPSANDNIMYVIEVDGRELPDGSPYLELQITNGANSVIASASAILTGGRYPGVSSPTVLT